MAIVLLLVLLSVFVNIYFGREIVYTHLFYLPIILAGLWYFKKALYVAAFLGLVHIGINFIQEGMFVSSTLIRAFLFLTIAYVIGTLAENKEQVLADLRETQLRTGLCCRTAHG